MDHAHMQPASSPPVRVSDGPSSQQTLRVSPRTSFAADISISDLSPSRQQRLLQHRNARFPAKKLSISGLSNKLTQLIGKNDQVDAADEPLRNQENKLHKSKSTGTIGSKNSLGILDEISNTTRSRELRRRAEIPIYQDSPERPLPESSPYAASSPHVDARNGFTSPPSFDHIQDSLNSMRLREVSVNERWSPLPRSPPSMKARPRKRSAQTQFDADEYIEHIEKELQQVRDEAYSPLTRRPMKEKLKAANRENERLQQELAMLKERFETDVKRTVEHKTYAELELRRRVRDLEESLEEKEHAFRELRYQHEERRLDTNIIETMKVTIERLEQEKLDMEEINLSMNKRNEVLTQLLAMSPTKLNGAFNLGSPVREKRGVRPLSLILPRLPSSPTAKELRHAGSVACSPQVLSSTDISPFKLSSDHEDDRDSREDPQKLDDEPQLGLGIQPPKPLPSPPAIEPASRRWTLYSEISASSASGADENRVPGRRKARKFLSGSTQLKPLLLPTLTGDNVSLPSTSTASSPRSWPVVPTYDSDLEDTVLPSEHQAQADEKVSTLSDHADPMFVATAVGSNSGPGPAYRDSNAIVNALEPGTVSRRDRPMTNHKLLESFDTERSSTLRESITRDYSTYSRNVKSGENHASSQSLRMMPIPTTPNSLVAIPRPLFSPIHKDAMFSQDDLGANMYSVSPAVYSQEQLNMRKRRKPPTSTAENGSPSAKVRRHRRWQSSIDFLHPERSHERHTAQPPIRSHGVLQLKHIRTSDNLMEFLRRKDFAARPLAAFTIRAVYKILSSCSSAIVELKRDPFALARRVLANAWYMNWKVFGKVSWWVLGLFITRQSTPKVRPSIDWDQFDGESIASRYCSSASDDNDEVTSSDEGQNGWVDHARINFEQSDVRDDSNEEQKQKPSWGRSLFLWGKFSAALVLAVGGAVVKGPAEMLKDISSTPRLSVPEQPARTHRNRRTQSSPHHRYQHSRHTRPRSRTYSPGPALEDTGLGLYMSDFEFRSDMQLDSSSFLEQIQQHDCDSALRPEQPPRKRVDDLFSPTGSAGGSREKQLPFI